jgi:Phage capsid-like protein
MPDETEHLTLSESAARQLANATKTRAHWRGITPRWLISFLNWTPVEAGIFRLNRVREEGEPTDVEASPPRDANPDLPETYVDYVHDPREYFLKAVTTVLDVQTRVSDLYSQPFDQVQEQLRLLIEGVKEKHESELINNEECGLMAVAAPSQRIRTRTGPPTPDDLDELLTKVWKEPGFFLLHPRAVAAFGREATRRGVPPPTVSLFGSQFITWRGIPLIPSDKIAIEDEKTKILLIRTGESRQGVVGLYQPNLPGEQSKGLSVRFMGINHKAIASYLVSLYCSLAALVDDALAVLDDVEVNKYHEYN